MIGFQTQTRPHRTTSGQIPTMLAAAMTVFNSESNIRVINNDRGQIHHYRFISQRRCSSRLDYSTEMSNKSDFSQPCFMIGCMPALHVQLIWSVVYLHKALHATDRIWPTSIYAGAYAVLHYLFSPTLFNAHRAAGGAVNFSSPCFQVHSLFIE